MITTLFPSSCTLKGLSFTITACSLKAWVGLINVLPIYLFLISPIAYGIPLSSAYPIAAGIPESGTPITISASIFICLARSLPAFTLASYTFIPSIILSGLAK